tara:strand:- start:584 stop:976 length:393 start_codon:yes stop_codon:yes gene_type:complete
MSTRANILIKCGENQIWLYRHFDGYLSETGYNLASILANSKSFNGFLYELLNQKYEPNIHRQSQKVYEFTSGMHGDIEYLYTLEFSNKTRFSVKFTVETVMKEEILIETDFFTVTRDNISLGLKEIIDSK